MNRGEEIRQLNQLSTEQLASQAQEKLLVLDDLNELHRHFARSIAGVVKSNNREGKATALILPFGPTGQYPVLREIVNEERISLRHTRLFFMDEHADASGQAVSSQHPLSFRGRIAWLWDAIDPDLRPLSENVIFPNQGNVLHLQPMIEEAGGIDVCYGGIGIHGHLAYNEPEPGVWNSNPRLVRLNDFTVTINSIRSQVGGDLENYPRYGWTLGMQQCLAARRVELYCRNDVDALDWANTVLRLAVLGEPGDDYPVTWIRRHPNWQVVTDRRTTAAPKIVL